MGVFVPRCQPPALLSRPPFDVIDTWCFHRHRSSAFRRVWPKIKLKRVNLHIRGREEEQQRLWFGWGTLITRHKHGNVVKGLAIVSAGRGRFISLCQWLTPIPAPTAPLPPPHTHSLVWFSLRFFLWTPAKPLLKNRPARCRNVLSSASSETRSPRTDLLD